jgi:hypothetical protein
VAFDGFRTFVKGTRAGSLTGGGQSFQKEVFGGNDKDRAGVDTRNMCAHSNYPTPSAGSGRPPIVHPTALFVFDSVARSPWLRLRRWFVRRWFVWWPALRRYVGMNELEIEEVDAAHGLTTNVLYFTLPGEKFNGIVRRTTFKNTGATALGIYKNKIKNTTNETFSPQQQQQQRRRAYAHTRAF